jgi:D-alanyl-D-alanine carboxypeptidase/D-alanyl-D-alanine-endopeptidase (penicillin-binding protein 4)
MRLNHCEFIQVSSILVCLSIGSIWSSTIFANQTDSDSKVDVKKALQKRLDFIFKDEALKSTQIGVEVYSLSQQERLYQLNSQSSLSPASAIKLLTAVVALKKLGPDYVYKTEVLIDGVINGNTLKGNMYIKGSGDPSLVTERLYLLVAEVARSGISRIDGQLIVDDWVFDQVRWDPARIPTQTDRPYNAPVGGVSFNYNTTTVHFRPGDKLGDPVKVFVEPDTGYVKIVNKAKTSGRGSGNKLVGSRSNGDGSNSITLTGTLGLGTSEQRSYFNITDPIVYTGRAFQMMLKERGITFLKNEVVHGQVPAIARKIASLDSLPMREIVTLMNKFSNNFIADVLVKTLGKEVKGSPGTMEKGIQVLTEESTRLNINTAGFKLVSGSGLTRENRMSSTQFVTLMNSSYMDFDVLPELLSSLPIAGKDGTLRSRMKSTSAMGRLRGKTGSIDGVSSLVGVVQSRGGELIAFSVLLNDRSKNPGSMKPWQNYLGQALGDFNRTVPLREVPDSIPAIMQPADSQERANPLESGEELE